MKEYVLLTLSNIHVALVVIAFAAVISVGFSRLFKLLIIYIKIYFQDRKMSHLVHPRL